MLISTLQTKHLLASDRSLLKVRLHFGLPETVLAEMQKPATEALQQDEIEEDFVDAVELGDFLGEDHHLHVLVGRASQRAEILFSPED